MTEEPRPSQPNSEIEVDLEDKETSIENQSSDSQHALMQQLDDVVAHVWMVRTFLKHSDEAADDEELAEVHRDLYDFMLALGPSLEANDPKKYLHIARKKLSKLVRAAETFREIQPEVSGHMNFKMAAKSLTIAVGKIQSLLGGN